VAFRSQNKELALVRSYLEEKHALANTLPGHFTTLHLIMLALWNGDGWAAHLRQMSLLILRKV